MQQRDARPQVHVIRVSDQRRLDRRSCRLDSLGKRGLARDKCGHLLQIAAPDRLNLMVQQPRQGDHGIFFTLGHVSLFPVP